MAANLVTVQARLPPTVDPGEYTATWCEIRQEFNTHAIALLKVRYATPRLQTITPWPELTPIQLVYGRGSDLASFFGYVHHPEINKVVTVGGGPTTVTYVLIGVSCRLNRANPRTWQSYTDSGIAAAIASGVGFAAVTDTTPLVHDSITQPNGVSDWQFLLGRAHEAGFRLWCDGPVLHMVDPAHLLVPQAGLQIPAYSVDLTHQGTTQIQTLEILAGSMLADSGQQAARTAHVLDASSGRVATITGGNAQAYLSSYGASFPLSSAADAMSAVAAADRRNSNWLRARAQLLGATALKPGQLISLSGRGVPATYRGLWLVTGSTHTLQPTPQPDPSGSLFNSTLELARNTELTYAVSNYSPAPITSPSVGGFTSAGAFQAWQSNFWLSSP